MMYGSSVFARGMAITERSELGLYDVSMFMSYFGIGIMFVNINVCVTMLVFSAMSWPWLFVHVSEV